MAIGLATVGVILIAGYLLLTAVGLVWSLPWSERSETAPTSFFFLAPLLAALVAGIIALRAARRGTWQRSWMAAGIVCVVLLPWAWPFWPVVLPSALFATTAWLMSKEDRPAP